MAVFPGSAITFSDTGLNNTNSLGFSTIVSDLSSSATSLSITSATNLTSWPTATFAVLIDNELIYVATRSGTTLSGLIRGHDGTAADVHTAGTDIIVVLASKSINVINAELKAVEDSLRGNIVANLNVDGTFRVKNTLSATGNLEVDGDSPATYLKFSNGTVYSKYSVNPTAVGQVLQCTDLGPPFRMGWGSASGSGVTSGANVGGATGLVFRDIVTNTINLRTIQGSGGTTVSTAGDVITISSSASGGTGDNLGNHTATTVLNMSGQIINNVSNVFGTGDYGPLILTGARSGSPITGGRIWIEQAHCYIDMPSGIARVHVEPSQTSIGPKLNFISTTGGSAGAFQGYIVVQVNGTDRKIPYYAM